MSDEREADFDARLASDSLGLALPDEALAGVEEAWKALGDHAARLRQWSVRQWSDSAGSPK